ILAPPASWRRTDPRSSLRVRPARPEVSLDEQDGAAAEDPNLVAGCAPAHAAAPRVDPVRAHDDEVGTRGSRRAHDLAGRLPDQYLSADRGPPRGGGVGPP